MIDEFRQYEFTAQAFERYRVLFDELCLPIRGDRYGVLQGMWQERIGDTVLFRHLWRYASLDMRAHLRGELMKVDAWREEFLPQAAACVGKQFVQVLMPKTEARSLAQVRFLHLYRCPVGKAGAVIEQIIDAGARAKSGVCGVWGTEFADPNQVVVMSARQSAPSVDVNASLMIETRCLQPLALESASRAVANG